MSVAGAWLSYEGGTGGTGGTGPEMQPLPVTR